MTVRFGHCGSVIATLDYVSLITEVDIVYLIIQLISNVHCLTAHLFRLKVVLRLNICVSLIHSFFNGCITATFVLLFV